MTTQKGHIYIKINEFFTATIRSIESLKNILSSNEEKTTIKIIEVSNVSKRFESEVRKIVLEYGSTVKNVEMYDLDRNGFVLYTFNFLIRTFKNGTIRIETLFADFGKMKTQKIKTNTKGDYITVSATIAKKWYF